jgi:hypothetical protein
MRIEASAFRQSRKAIVKVDRRRIALSRDAPRGKGL